MKTQRYNFFYILLTKFLTSLSPDIQKLLATTRLALFVLLVGLGIADVIN